MLKYIRKHKYKKGFTLIELIVVIAIIAVLVLLASSKFLGKTDEARLRHIQNDIKGYETAIAVELLENSDLFDSWGRVYPGDLDDNIETGKLYSKKGLVEEMLTGEYYEVDKSLMKTNLDGSFVVGDGGDVYYVGSGGKITNRPLSDSEIEALIADGYIPIATAEELDHIAKNNNEPIIYGKGTKWETDGPVVGNLSSNYIQVRNINMSDLDDHDGKYNFTPIGDSRNPFKGTFNGNRYKIYNLFIDREEKYNGLFGYVESSSTIENVALYNVDVTGLKYTGSLVGWIKSSEIKNSYAIGKVVSSGTYSGGLAGIARYTDISRSYAKVSVVGGEQVGGLIGYAMNSNIKEAYATGNVDGGAYAGGLIGKMESSLATDSYSTGNVNGGNGSGGLVGLLSRGDIYRSYSTGKVSGSGSTGGIAGSRNNSGFSKGTISSSFFDKDTSGQVQYRDEGKSTSEMQDKSTFTNSGWDFQNVWEITPGNYPTLINNP